MVGRIHNSGRYASEVRRFVIENNTDSSSLALNPEYINNCEISFKLSEHEELGKWYPNYTRENITFDEVVSDSIFFDDISLRFHEELIIDFISPYDFSDAQWGASALDDIILFDETIVYQAYQHAINEPLVLSDDFYDFQVYVSDIFSIDGQPDVSFPLSCDDNFAFIDSSYGFFVEEVTSVFYPLDDEPLTSLIFLADDSFSVFSSDVWDNHFDCDESLVVESSDVWDNHLDCETFAHFDEDSVPALLEMIDEFFELVEDHFDGYWVEDWEETICVTDSVLTQAWRHEWFMGVIINSYQLNPIEQPGMDGYRVGTTDPDIFGA